ncbi:MAG: hypothetical protein ABGX00_14540 [Allomuricauda sp.]
MITVLPKNSGGSWLHIPIHSLLLILLLGSCSKTDACEESNTGALIIQNTRTTGVLKIFFDNEPISGNVPGDLNIQPGETAKSDQLAGQRIIYALLDLSTCVDNRCTVRNEALPERTVDLGACEESNLSY